MAEVKKTEVKLDAKYEPKRSEGVKKTKTPAATLAPK